MLQKKFAAANGDRMAKKLNSEKKEKAAPEKHFARAVELFFKFHKSHYRDRDGFALEPSWNAGTRGMEYSSLKKILTTLREISEGKGFEWTEDRMTHEFNIFMEQAYNHTICKKNFLCCMMNRFKFDILSSTFNPHLSKKIREVWYFENPDYPVDVEKDRFASEVIVGFLKQQFVLSGKEATEQAMVSSWNVIVQWLKWDDFWWKKSLRSISNNLQEFVQRIKSEKNGSVNRGDNSKQRPFATSDSKITALKKWGVAAIIRNQGSEDSKRDT